MEEYTDRLLDAFLTLRTHEEVRDFLKDILTPDELERLPNRWLALELMAEGLSGAEVHRRTGLSRVTTGRAARVLRSGTGMVRTVLERLNVTDDS